ncbi:MAG: hypothetical protein AAB834_05655 [Patescibacteria group bacterium]
MSAEFLGDEVLASPFHPDKLMQEIYISKIPNILITFRNQKVKLPGSIREKIDQYWNDLTKDNSHLRNGEVFTVTSVQESEGRTVITLAETDYAHYLYSQQVGGLGEYTVRIIHPASLVVSKDNRFIFGSMGEHTSRPGIIQCCGGGIDHSNIKGGTVDVEHNIAKELVEELGLNINDTNRVASCRPAYLKTGGPTGKMTIVYVLRLKQTAQTFLSVYEKFVQELRGRSEEPEFGELFSIQASPESIEEFISQNKDRLNEYMAVTLRQAQKDLAQA